MTILDCPRCGGIHYGSVVCPFTDEDIARMNAQPTTPDEDELDPEDDEDILDPVGEPDGFPDVDED